MQKKRNSKYRPIKKIPIPKKNPFTNVLVRIPDELLKKMDEEVLRKSWGTRTSWILEAINEKINDYMK